MICSFYREVTPYEMLFISIFLVFYLFFAGNVDLIPSLSVPIIEKTRCLLPSLPLHSSYES